MTKSPDGVQDIPPASGYPGGAGERSGWEQPWDPISAKGLNLIWPMCRSKSEPCRCQVLLRTGQPGAGLLPLGYCYNQNTLGWGRQEDPGGPSYKAHFLMHQESHRSWWDTGNGRFSDLNPDTGPCVLGSIGGDFSGSYVPAVTRLCTTWQWPSQSSSFARASF